MSETGNFFIDAKTAQKILRPLSYIEGFHFFLPNGMYTGETAISLFTFSKEIESIDPESVRYHFQRNDFQNWIKSTLGDEELAERINKLELHTSDDNLRRELIELIEQRLKELQSIIRAL